MGVEMDQNGQLGGRNTWLGVERCGWGSKHVARGIISYKTRRKKKKTHLGPKQHVWHCLGPYWPSLAVGGCRWPSVAFVWPVGAEMGD